MTNEYSSVLQRLKNGGLVQHAHHKELQTLSFIQHWNEFPLHIEYPRLKLTIQHVDYLYQAEENKAREARHLIRFQQHVYRLWYQLNGNGILQNVTRNQFGSARAGLLGIMSPGERHAYLHQRGTFECFLLDFSLRPTNDSEYYWNSESEGKAVLDGNERDRFEDDLICLLHQVPHNDHQNFLYPLQHIIRIIITLFEKGLLLVNGEQFPENKQRSVVAMAKIFMNDNYGKLRHQQALEEQCGVDINYLNILFRRETGSTLYKYLTDVRMEHAKYLLEENNLNVSQISTMIGYPNANSFTRIFKKSHGMTPSAYRKKHLNAVK